MPSHPRLYWHTTYRKGEGGEISKYLFLPLNQIQNWIHRYIKMASHNQCKFFKNEKYFGFYTSKWRKKPGACLWIRNEMHPLWWAYWNITELTVPLPKYLVQQDSFFSDMSLQDVTSFSGVWLFFLETALVFQETFLRSNCSILCFCSWRLCSSSWILICQETDFF